MPELKHVRCQREQVLMDADSSLEHIFFPDSGVISVLAVYADGDSIEMATIGREGCAGVQALFGTKRSSARLLVQIPEQKPAVITAGPNNWCNVMAPTAEGYQNFAFNPEQRRWSYGEAPTRSGVIAKAIREHFSPTPAQA